jgi:hypothetical protein
LDAGALSALRGQVFQKKMRLAQKYCAPGFDARFSHFGFSGSAGGRIGLGPTWQKAHDIPTR